MKDLVDKGDYQLQDETLTSEIETDLFDHFYFTSITISYSEHFLKTASINENSREVLIHLNYLLDSVFLNNENFSFALKVT